MAPPSKNLLDPETCGEDLFAIANRAAELSETLCKDCASYHFRIPAFRAVGRSESLEKDRLELIEEIKEIRQKSSAKETRFELLIAGSADTGLLATAAHAVALLGPDALHQTHFTVIDRCPTPLQLCTEFAMLHGINCTVIQGDLLAVTPRQRADMVVMHSVLRFFSANDRVEFMRRVKSWLAPHGVVLISNSYGSQSQQQRHSREIAREANLQRVVMALELGQLQSVLPINQLTSELRGSFIGSLDRDRVFLDPSDLEHLAISTGLRIKYYRLTSPLNRTDGTAQNTRIHALLEA